jgi:hypothetical protein
VGVEGAGLEGLPEVEALRFSGVWGRGVLGAVENVVGTSGEEVVAWIRGGLRVWFWFGVLGGRGREEVDCSWMPALPAGDISAGLEICGADAVDVRVFAWLVA